MYAKSSQTINPCLLTQDQDKEGLDRCERVMQVSMGLMVACDSLFARIQAHQDQTVTTHKARELSNFLSGYFTFSALKNTLHITSEIMIYGKKCNHTIRYSLYSSLLLSFLQIRARL